MQALRLSRQTIALADRFNLKAEFVQRIVDTMYAVYDSIGHDAWGQRTPDDDEFADVILEQFNSFTHPIYGHDSFRISAEDRAAYEQLTAEQRRSIALLAGP